ncbi:MAG TPA: thiamine-binding protein [Vicinamibacteria bacterium]|nr:thiamine-binding protein [Vicinamibacteria bacterium]
MLFEVSVIPVGGDIHMSDELGDVLSVVDRSGLPYQLGPGSTCIEGDWDEAIAVVRDCHRAARRTSKHVITLVKIEDDEGQSGKLLSNVTSVEEKAGRPLATSVAAGSGDESARAAAPAPGRRRAGDGTSSRSRRARA